jgi:hypothetical protein
VPLQLEGLPCQQLQDVARGGLLVPHIELKYAAQPAAHFKLQARGPRGAIDPRQPRAAAQARGILIGRIMPRQRLGGSRRET